MSINQGYPQILVIEFGSQYTLKIESSLRELGYRSVVLNPKRAAEWLAQRPVKGIILSGGLASVYDEDAPAPPKNIFDLPSADGRGTIPVLGICYGMQWIAKHFGGTVAPATPEYGHARISVPRPCPLFFGTPPDDQEVWASHGDSVSAVPPEFKVIAVEPGSKAIAAIEGRNSPIYGVQFHPEVEGTPHGKNILRNFARLCNCERDWAPRSMVEEIQEEALREIGSGDAVLGVSGGVDSSVAGAILSKALGNRLHGLTINAGNLRENELNEIRDNARAASIPLIVADEQDRFFAALAGITDAQEKRKKGFQPHYSAVFQEMASRIGGVTHMVQGTLAPDRIESGATGGDVIKQHHNVGLDTGALKQLHPLAKLFKYEVRALAKEMGLPESIWKRQPFPGPGLFIRHIGAVTREGIETVRWADHKMTIILRSAGVYDDYSQTLAAYFDTPVVGVRGDKRVYSGFVGVRAVKTIDFMTAEGVEFDVSLQREIKRALSKHPKIVHTAFFPTDKPPATTEFE